MINNTPYIHIKDLAEFIALQYDDKITPVDEIVKQENLQLFYDHYDKDTFDGITVYADGYFYIHLNIDNGNRKDSVRGRYTLGHELGHYFLDTHRIGLKLGILEPHPSIINRKQFYAIEREADYFASCLLMPEFRFTKDVFKKKFSFELIDFLSKQYQVSITACAFRFAQIGNHPIMIVYAERGRIKWKMESDDFPYKWLLNGLVVPVNTVMGEYFARNNTQDIYKTEQIWAIDWFNYVRDRDVNRAFFEHCIPYNDKALSIIWER